MEDKNQKDVSSLAQKLEKAKIIDQSVTVKETGIVARNLSVQMITNLLEEAIKLNKKV